MGYISVAVRSKTPSGVAGFLWNQWQLCYGISGRFGVEYAERIRPLSLDKATSLLFICLKPDAISRMLLIIGDTGTSGTRAWVHRSPIHCAIKSFESLNSIRRW